MIFFIILALFSFFLGQVSSLTVPANLNTVLSWKNSQGTQQQLFISCKQIAHHTTLIKKSSLPYSFIVEQNCNIVESDQIATLYTPIYQKRYTLEYSYLSGTQIIKKQTIQFSDNTSINLNNFYFLFINVSQVQKDIQNNLVYIYDNQTFIKIDSKIHSDEPTCYQLSRMRSSLCREKSCMTLSPKNIYDMGIGNVTQISQNIYGQFNLKDTQIDLSKQKIQVFLNQIESDGRIKQYQGLVEHQNISFSSQAKLSIFFELIGLTNQQNDSKNNLKTENQDQKPQIKYNLKITIKNSQLVYMMKRLRIYDGQSLKMEDKILFKPLQIAEYNFLWVQNKDSIPAVEVYNQMGEREYRIVMSNYIENQQSKLLQTRYQNQQLGTPITGQIQNIMIVQQRQTISIKIIMIAVGGGLFLVLSIILFLCRNKIKQKLFKQKPKEEAAKSNKQQEEQKQSGREFNIPYQITFKKQKNITQPFGSASTQDKSNRSIPQEISNRNQCSIEEYMPAQADRNNQNNLTQLQQYKSSQKDHQVVESYPQPIAFKKRQRSFYDEISNSNTINISQSYTRKNIKKRKNIVTIKQEQQTQNV